MFLSHPHNPTAPVITAHNGSIEHNLTDLFPGFLKSSFDVGYIGAFYQGRGLDIVLSIASRLPEISFHLAGGQIEELKQLAPGSEVPSNIHVYGFISPSETYQFRNSCDLLLAPYHRSGVSVSNRGDTSQFMNPIKIIEYMSAQKPIVASDLPAIREVLDKGCALLVDPDSPQEWIEAIKELSLNPSLRDTLSHKSYQRFKASLTWNKRAEKLISIKD